MLAIINYSISIILLFAIVNLSSCKKLNCNDMAPFPAPYTIDADQDGIEDFIVGYGIISSDDPSNACSWSGKITRLDSNYILRRDGYPKVFLQPNDTIRKDYNTNPEYEWRTSCSFMRGNNYEDPGARKRKYNTNWLHPTKHYMGIKINRDNQIKIGWLKFYLDTDYGKIILVGAKITDEDWIVIE